MVKHTLKILQHLLQDFQSVFDHFGTLCIKRVSELFNNWSCFAVIALTEFLSYELYTVYEKEPIATSFST